MTPINKTTPEPSQQAAAKTTPTAKAQAAKTSDALPSPAPSSPARTISALIASTGLPADKLSASIISFARFFSLPMKPELMAEIRRQAFTQPTAAAETNQPETAKSGSAEQSAAAKNRETLSLAATAAESKGVELKEKALEAYAETIDPEWDKRKEGEGEKRRQQNKNQNDKEDGEQKKTMPITAPGIKETALKAEENNPLLSILNRLPGKDGRRWVVLPFEFSDNGRDFRVSLRILLETSNNANYMALDIMETEKANSRQLYVLGVGSREWGVETSAPHSLLIYLQHEIAPKAKSLLISDLSKALQIKPERIFIKTAPETFAFEAERGEELLRSIDEVA